MTYDDITEIVEKYQYAFPIIGDDGSGHQIVINYGKEPIGVDDELVMSAYYDVYTYLEGGKIVHQRYYEVGIVIDIPEQ